MASRELALDGEISSKRALNMSLTPSLKILESDLSRVSTSAGISKIPRTCKFIFSLLYFTEIARGISCLISVLLSLA